MKISKNNNFLSYNFDICGLGKKKIKFSISENDGFIYQSKSLSKKDLNFYYRNLAEYTIGNKVIKNKSKTKIIKNYISKIKNILPRWGKGAENLLKKILIFQLLLTSI